MRRDSKPAPAIAAEPTPEAELEAATVRGPGGRVRGFRAVGPSGQMVLLRPDQVRLDATVERGVHIVGLKPGWRLATEEDERKLAAANAERDTGGEIA